MLNYIFKAVLWLPCTHRHKLAGIRSQGGWISRPAWANCVSQVLLGYANSTVQDLQIAIALIGS
jgi:hypothetical protein